MSSPYIDVARGVLQQVVAGAQDALSTAQEKLDEVTEKHHLRSLMADLGEAYYAEQRSSGTQEDLEAALGVVDAHVKLYGSPASETSDVDTSDADGADVIQEG